MSDLRAEIQSTLPAFTEKPLREAAADFLATLGYRSDRTLPIHTPRQFLDQLDAQNRLTGRERDTLQNLQSLHLLFQLTDAELTTQRDLLEDTTVPDKTRIHSYLFFAAELPPGNYTRTDLSTLVRAINKPLPMPALVLFQHGDALSLGIIHRRLHKRNQAKDVLEKVTLIKDIACADPIRAHLEILNDFAKDNLAADYGFHNFVSLHEAWQKRLGSYALSDTFYREIADWYFWAHHQVDDGAIRLPLHCDTGQEKSLFLIRLLTRVIFTWFLVEKRLIPADLFRQHRLKALLKDFAPSRDPARPDTSPAYYRAILQNLFFGTLNMPPEQRAFRQKKRNGQRYDANYGITNLWRYEAAFRDPAAWSALAEKVPFLNGGLFDCLDDKSGKKQDNFILDGFSDREDHGCHLPNDLFFGPERSADLSKDYGEETKKTARSRRAKVRGLIEILSRYKFTIEENTPLEEEIALDPELLGKVFENLLASYNEDTRTTARKALGAFYTPREIVGYMVDEALKSYLSTQVPRCKGLLDLLFSNKPEGLREKLDATAPGTRDALIAAIGRVKILDPACGSGAFPMGALHRLVDLLQKLDPNNESWKRDRLAEAHRYRQLLEESDAGKDEIAACDARIADIEKSFDTRFHALDFARKLYLIENSIYGVDIQPIATQIAKLRFFISLVIDQKVDPGASNLGVRPLPNLETRLVAADTLIPIEKAESDLLTGELDQLRADLAAIRHEHFNARSPAAKRKWRDADEAKRHEIADQLERNHALPKESARKLAAWDPYDQNEFAPFFDSEWMFGLPVGKVKWQAKAPATLLGNLALINEAGGQGELTAHAPREIDSGFDIIIGNPPYIRLQTLKQKDPKLVAFFKDHYASAAKGNYDIYVVFIEAGLRLLKSDGHLAYICPHKFFNAEYGEPLRRLIASGRHLRHVVHFGDEQVFFGATIYTCLLFLAKAGCAECRFVKAHDLDAWKSKLTGEEGRFMASDIGAADWNFAVGAAATVFEKLRKIPRTLGQEADLFVGVQTDADDVFILEVLDTRQGVVKCYSKFLDAECEVEHEHLKPFVKGSLNIRRFHLADVNKLLLFPYETINNRSVLIAPTEYRKRFPLTWKYLEKCRKRLEARVGGAFSDYWHGYVYKKNHTRFNQPKLLVPAIGNQACFATDVKGRYYFVGSGGGGGGGYGIVLKNGSEYSLRSLEAVLNSALSTYFLKQTSTSFRGGYFAMNRQFIEQIPLVTPTKEQLRQLAQMADFLSVASYHFATHPADQTTRDPLMQSYWERILNGLVYELYFPEEVHGAGLRLFDLVEVAHLPDVTILPAPARLPRLRQKFEELHDGAHPLRIALDKLQTFDVVRIIEGKA